jgi:hypothetical protein
MPRSVLLVLVTLAITTCARPAAAQAWAPRAGQREVTFVTQMIDHVGRVFGDVHVDCCGTTNVGIDVDVDYGLSDRWSASVSLPYVFAKYRGEPPNGPVAFLPYPAVDSCHCVHSSLQDVAVASHYNLLKVRRSFSLMTSVSVGNPTHNYEYAGEAVVGFGLKELHLTIDAGLRNFIVPGLSVNGQYGYSIVERVLDIGHNRSNPQFETATAGRTGLAGTRFCLCSKRTAACGSPRCATVSGTVLRVPSPVTGQLLSGGRRCLVFNG